jgi:hypothetical protein
MSVQQLAKKAGERDKKTQKEEKTLTKKHKDHVTNAPVPSRQDTGFKNTRAEVGPSTGGTIAPQGSASKAPKAKSFGSSSSISGSSSGGGGGGGKRFCAKCGTARGAGAFCSSCGERL